MRIPILQHFNDYISNPKSEKWSNGEYPVGVVYQWEHKPTGETGTREIRVKHYTHAQRIVAYWNSVQDDYKYILENDNTESIRDS